MNCSKCGKNTKNPKYCSRSCAVSDNNKIPKRKLRLPCKKCQTLIKSNRTYCKKCYSTRVVDITLKKAVYEKHHKSSAFALVRSRARALIKSLQVEKKCQNCSYDKHFEVCHRRPISSFPLNTLVSVVNDPHNLAILCCNCHWESEHGLLDISSIPHLACTSAKS